MTTDAKLIHDWFHTFKQTAVCMTCQKEGLPYQLGAVEFHHIDASAKRDTLSNMAFQAYRFPDKYTIAPVTVALEVMKCGTLCSDHHRELHRAERLGDTDTLRRRYDFTDPFYVEKVRAFRQHALDVAPPALMKKIHDGMWSMLEEGIPTQPASAPTPALYYSPVQRPPVVLRAPQ